MCVNKSQVIRETSILFCFVLCPKSLAYKVQKGCGITRIWEYIPYRHLLTGFLWHWVTFVFVFVGVFAHREENGPKARHNYQRVVCLKLQIYKFTFISIFKNQLFINKKLDSLKMHFVPFLLSILFSFLNL